MNSFPELQSTASTLFSAYASLAATMMLLRSMANDVIPPQLISYITAFISKFFSKKLTANVTIIVDEQNGMTRNEVYDSAEIYLGTKLSPDADRFKVNKSPRQKNINVNIEKNEEVKDLFENIQLTWRFVAVEPEGNKSQFSEEKKFFELIFEKKYKDKIVSEYLPFVIAKAKEIKEKDRDVKLYTRDCPYNSDDDNGVWGSIKLEHPSTFETLAMEPEMKQSITDDLDRFVRRRDFYKKVGKAWKRGYLLYGPPGTGKSSLIAAIANYLKFDIYDLELTSLYSNSELRRILVSTTNRSIVVIEDIDCSVEMHDRENADNADRETSSSKLTLSGLLNFIDGLWSSCGDERLIIFTTNHKDKLDPALLRPGRMDMHIHMSYCTFNGFKVLAFNYLGITDYPKLFDEIEGLIENINVTPAEIAEELMRSEEVDGALQGVVNLLLKKKETAETDKIDDDEKSVKVNNFDDDEKCSKPEANGIEEERDLDGSESLLEAKKLETKKIVNDVLRDYGIRRRRKGRGVGKKGL